MYLKLLKAYSLSMSVRDRQRLWQNPSSDLESKQKAKDQVMQKYKILQKVKLLVSIVSYSILSQYSHLRPCQFKQRVFEVQYKNVLFLSQ